MLFKVSLHVSIVVDNKTSNWLMKDNLATALNCSLDNATRGRSIVTLRDSL